MNTNTLCLRIFFVFSLLLLAAGILFIYGARLITPLALAWLPTQTAEAGYANPYVWMEAHVQGRQRLYRSQIQYDGHTSTLISTAAPTQLQPLEAPGEKEFFDRLKKPSTPAEEPKEETFTVRYVTRAPTLVAREIPNPSLGNWIAETWSLHDLGPLLTLVLPFAALAYAFRRHLKNSRRDRRY